MGSMSGPTGNPGYHEHHEHGNFNNSNGVNVIGPGNAGGNFRGTGNFRHDHGNNTNITIRQRNFTAPHRFHIGTYERPRGWYYRRWSYGDRLPSIFFASNFWIPNYVAFDLDEPPPGYVWVRYGDDALLVDRYTGEIVEVEYGVFY